MENDINRNKDLKKEKKERETLRKQKEEMLEKR